MPIYRKELGGAAILGDLKAKLEMVQRNINESAARQDWPTEYRRNMRTEAVKLARSLVDDARLAFAGWATDKNSEAVATWNADPVGSPAQESRRAANEAKLARLIQAGQSQAQIEVVDGQVVRNPRAARYAATAESLYLEGGRYDEAVVYADAAIALGADARQTRQLAEAQHKLEDPDKAGAFRDIAKVRSLTIDFERVVAGSMTRALSSAAEAARAIGDDGYGYAGEATRLSMAAKVAAMAKSAETGEAYEAPDGALDAESGIRSRPALAAAGSSQP